MQHVTASQKGWSGTLLLAAVLAAFLTGLLGAAGLAFISQLSLRAIVLALLYATTMILVTGTVVWSANSDLQAILILAAAAVTVGVTLPGTLSYGALLLPALLFWSIAGGLAWRRYHPSPTVVALALVCGFGVALLASVVLVMVTPRG